MVLSRQEMALTIVRSLVPLISRHHSYNVNTIVPCSLNTSISMNVGGKHVSISPASFNLGRVSPGSDLCLAGAAGNRLLTSSELVRRFLS